MKYAEDIFAGFYLLEELQGIFWSTHTEYETQLKILEKSLQPKEHRAERKRGGRMSERSRQRGGEEIWTEWK